MQHIEVLSNLNITFLQQAKCFHRSCFLFATSTKLLKDHRAMMTPIWDIQWRQENLMATMITLTSSLECLEEPI